MQRPLKQRNSPGRQLELVARDDGLKPEIIIVSPNKQPWLTIDLPTLQLLYHLAADLIMVTDTLSLQDTQQQTHWKCLTISFLFPFLLYKTIVWETVLAKNCSLKSDWCLFTRSQGEVFRWYAHKDVWFLWKPVWLVSYPVHEWFKSITLLNNLQMLDIP